MFDKNFDYVKVRQKNLLSIAERERLSRDLRNETPSVKVLVLLRLGDIFINLAKKLKKAGDTCEEVPLAEFSPECL